MSVALITGCASPRGIGFATAVRFARQGWGLAVLDRAAEPLREAAALIAEEGGGEVLPLVCDVTSADQVKAAVAGALERFGRIDAVVNNAGITSPTRIEAITEEEWDQLLAIDIKGVFLVTQAVLPAMREAGYGRIVNVSSVAGKRGGGIVGGVHYAAAKAAVLGFTKAVAREVAAEGITSNAVAPGLIETEMPMSVMTDERRRAWIEELPVGRLGRPQDIAAAVAFLCSEDAGYVTGEEIDVNGGMHMD